MVVKCLSVRKPWAHLIIYGTKTIENRTWKTNYRGPLYIHSSLKWDPRSRDPFHMFTRLQYQKIHRLAMTSIASHDDSDVVGGVILGRVRLADCVRGFPGKYDDERYSMWGEWTKHRTQGWHWIIEDPEALLEPIEVKGSLGIFKREIPEDLKYG